MIRIKPASGLLSFALIAITVLTPLLWGETANSAPGDAPKPPIVLSDAEKEADFLALSEELRCLVCQNQNLADSNADLAYDLRREVAKLLEEGKDRDSVKDFMVARYGDFVLYDPPVKPSTYLLWTGPFLLLLLGFVVILRKIKSDAGTVSKSGPNKAALSEEEQKRLHKLLQSDTSQDI